MMPTKKMLVFVAGIVVFLQSAASAGITVRVDPMTDEKIRTLVITSSTQAPNSIGVMEDVHMVIRCQASKTELYIMTTTYNADNRMVRVRWDAEQAENDYWSSSTDNSGLFSPAPKDSILRLTTAKKFAFGWHPYAGGRNDVVFSLEGYRKDIRTMNSVCK